MSIMAQCSGCAEVAASVSGAALPDAWDALRIPGFLPMLFCDGCVGSGRMEDMRARQCLPRRQRWSFPGSILAMYRPAARQVLIATGDGMAELSEGEAVRLHAAIGQALAVRDLAQHMSPSPSLSAAFGSHGGPGAAAEPIAAPGIDPADH